MLLKQIANHSLDVQTQTVLSTTTFECMCKGFKLNQSQSKKKKKRKRWKCVTAVWVPWLTDQRCLIANLSVPPIHPSIPPLDMTLLINDSLSIFLSYSCTNPSITLCLTLINTLCLPAMFSLSHSSIHPSIHPSIPLAGLPRSLPTVMMVLLL